ncbi:MAG: hypothetical protein JNK11_03655, partial [Alphaproteobacteria bacterium]|nr:hypothetical protein [Alphaproteobacteria bacterium]
LERELHATNFLRPADKVPAMVRNLRAMLQRADMTEQEVRTWRGVISALAEGRPERETSRRQRRLLERAAKRAAQAEAEVRVKAGAVVPLPPDPAT